MTFRAIRLSTLLLFCCLSTATPSLAEGMGVVAVVNDQPITELDITQRISLMKILQDGPEGGLSRKAALQMIVDDVVKIEEAKRVRYDASDTDITKHIERMTKNMKTTPADLLARLSKQGIGEASFRKYIRAQIGFNRIIGSKYRDQVKVTPAEVDAKLGEIKQKVNQRIAEIKKDPRAKPVTVYTLLEITLPVEQNDAMAAQLLQARAVEAVQVGKQFKGCKNARAAASGVYNVKFGKPIEAVAEKLPPPMRSALDKAGVGKAIGPMRGKGGIQLIGFCGVRKITPKIPEFQMPTRDQVENMLVNEQYAGIEEKYLKEARPKVYVEYRNSSYSQ